MEDFGSSEGGKEGCGVESGSLGRELYHICRVPTRGEADFAHAVC